MSLLDNFTKLLSVAQQEFTTQGCNVVFNQCKDVLINSALNFEKQIGTDLCLKAMKECAPEYAKQVFPFVMLAAAVGIGYACIASCLSSCCDRPRGVRLGTR